MIINIRQKDQLSPVKANYNKHIAKYSFYKAFFYIENIY